MKTILSLATTTPPSGQNSNQKAKIPRLVTCRTAISKLDRGQKPILEKWGFQTLCRCTNIKSCDEDNEWRLLRLPCLSSLFCCLFRLISHEHPPCMHDYDLLLVLPSNQPLVESSFASALLAAAHICDISLINGPMHLKKEPQQFFLLRSLFSTQFSKSFHQNERWSGRNGRRRICCIDTIGHSSSKLL